jgi:hypothetical protein
MVVSVIFIGHFEELVKARGNLENVNVLISMGKVILVLNVLTGNHIRVWPL